MTNAERVASLTDDELRRSLDRAGLPLALRLRENELTLERGIGPGGRTYTLYDKTGRVLALDDADEIRAGPPFDRPARGMGRVPGGRQLPPDPRDRGRHGGHERDARCRAARDS